MRTRSQSQQHTTLAPDNNSVYQGMNVRGVLNRLSLMEAPVRGKALASVCVPWKKWLVKLIFAAFGDKQTFVAPASTQEL